MILPWMVTFGVTCCPCGYATAHQIWAKWRCAAALSATGARFRGSVLGAARSIARRCAVSKRSIVPALSVVTRGPVGATIASSFAAEEGEPLHAARTAKKQIPARVSIHLL